MNASSPKLLFYMIAPSLHSRKSAPCPHREHFFRNEGFDPPSIAARAEWGRKMEMCSLSTQGALFGRAKGGLGDQKFQIYFKVICGKALPVYTGSTFLQTKASIAARAESGRKGEMCSLSTQGAIFGGAKGGLGDPTSQKILRVSSVFLRKTMVLCI